MTVFCYTTRKQLVPHQYTGEPIEMYVHATLPECLVVESQNFAWYYLQDGAIGFSDRPEALTYNLFSRFWGFFAPEYQWELYDSEGGTALRRNGKGIEISSWEEGDAAKKPIRRLSELLKSGQAHTYFAFCGKRVIQVFSNSPPPEKNYELFSELEVKILSSPPEELNLAHEAKSRLVNVSRTL